MGMRERESLGEIPVLWTEGQSFKIRKGKLTHSLFTCPWMTILVTAKL